MYSIYIEGKFAMGILYWSKDVILVDLPRKLQEHDELQEVIEMVRTRRDCSVIVDFSRVDVAACTTLTRFLTLRRVLLDRRQKLILCNVATATKGVFTITRLDEVLDFVKDKFTALAQFHIAG